MGLGGERPDPHDGGGHGAIVIFPLTRVLYTAARSSTDK